MTPNIKDRRYNVVQLSKSRMMTAMIIQIVTLMGVSVTAERSSFLSDLISDCLYNLTDKTISFNKYTCIAHLKLSCPNNYNLIRSIFKPLVLLMIRVKGKNRMGETIEFPAVVTRVLYLEKLKEAYIREYCCKSQKQNGESIVLLKFLMPLKGSAQWERWFI